MRTLILSLFACCLFTLSTQANTVFLSDDCSTATDIETLFDGAVDDTQTSMMFDNSTATADMDDTTAGYECFLDTGGPAVTNSLWFTFTGDGETYFITTGDCGGTAMNYITDGDTQLALYSGSSCDALTPVACNEDVAFPNVAAGFTVATEAGVDYYLLVDGYDGATGEYCLEVTQLMVTTGDASDDCASATDIDALFGGTIDEPQLSATFDNTDATTGDDDPTEGIDCFFENDGLDNTVWFTFTGDGGAYFIIANNCNGAVTTFNNDTQFALYSGDSCDDLTPVACNEDFGPATGDFRAALTFITEPGVNYYLLVDGYQGTVGEFCLEVTQLENILCDDIELSTFTNNAPVVCFGETTSFDFTGETTVPTGPAAGFLFAVTTEDISGSTDPFNEDSYFGAFGIADEPYNPALVNDGDPLAAGTYFFTPIVFGNADGVTTNLPGLDFTDGCLIVGMSMEVELVGDLAPLSTTVTTSPETGAGNNDGEATVEVTGGSGDFSYMWSNGETTATITGLGADTYTVTVTDNTGCVEDATDEAVVDLMSDAGDPSFLAAVRISPNPANEIAYIDFSFQQSHDLMVRITNAVGQTVWQQQLPQTLNQQVPVELAAFAEGVYFVHITDGNKQLTRLLAVSR